MIAVAKSLRTSSNALFGEQIRHWRKLRIHHTRGTPRSSFSSSAIARFQRDFKVLSPLCVTEYIKHSGGSAEKEEKKHRREIVFNAL
jgi:hypothetical protein